MRFFSRKLALGLGLLAAVEASAQPQPAPGEFLCLRGGATRHVDRSLRFTPRSAIGLGDRFVGAPGIKIDVKKTLGLCLPAGLTDASPALEPYAAKVTRTRPTQARPVIVMQRVTNRFGTDELDVKGLDDVLVPSSAVLDPPPAPSSVPGALDAFACYEVEAQQRPRALLSPRRRSRSRARSVRGNSTSARRPGSAFPPTSTARTRAPRPIPPRWRAIGPSSRGPSRRRGSRFPGGHDRQPLRDRVADAERRASTSACPSEVIARRRHTDPAAHRRPDADADRHSAPDFTLRVDPAAATVDIGTSAHLKATAVFTNGDTADFTERVLWRRAARPSRRRTSRATPAASTPSTTAPP